MNKFILSKFWILKVQNQDVKIMLLLKPLRGKVFACLFNLLVTSGVHCKFCFYWLSSLCLSFLLFLGGQQSYWIRAYLIQYDLI